MAEVQIIKWIRVCVCASFWFDFSLNPKCIYELYRLFKRYDISCTYTHICTQMNYKCYFARKFQSHVFFVDLHKIRFSKCDWISFQLHFQFYFSSLDYSSNCNKTLLPSQLSIWLIKMCYHIRYIVFSSSSSSIHI